MTAAPRSTRRVRAIGLLLGLALGAGCRTGRNYSDLEVQRTASAARMPPDSAADRMPDSLRLVTFNIKYGRRIEEAIGVFVTDPNLRGADVMFLQEMDGAGTARIANALGMGYVYYPSTFHLRTHRDFGNAILSRWPIVSDARVTLPHHSRLTYTQRIATAATIRIGQRLVRVYSAHLGTIADIGQGARRDQLERVFADAMRYPYVIVGGDMNSASAGPVARQHGFTWLTARNARTTVLGRWDHVFTRGFEVPDQVPTGVSGISRAASDHRAVWTVLPTRARVGDARRD